MVIAIRTIYTVHIYTVHIIYTNLLQALHTHTHTYKQYTYRQMITTDLTALDDMYDIQWHFRPISL